MKNIKLSIVAVVSVMSLVHAGGDISPVTPYETNDIQEANLEAVEIVEPKEVIPVIPPIKEEPKVVESKEVEPKIVQPKEEYIKNSNSGIYIGLGGAIAEYDTNCNCKTGKSGKDETVGAVAKVGYDINRYIGIEARGIKTSLEENGGKVTHYGAYIKPMLPIGDKTKAYALVGYGKSKTTGHLRKTDIDGFAWGLGIDYKVTDNISAFVDYQNLINKSDSNSPKLDIINIGANYNF